MLLIFKYTATPVKKLNFAVQEKHIKPTIAWLFLNIVFVTPLHQYWVYNKYFSITIISLNTVFMYGVPADSIGIVM